MDCAGNYFIDAVLSRQGKLCIIHHVSCYLLIHQADLGEAPRRGSIGARKHKALPMPAVDIELIRVITKQNLAQLVERHIVQWRVCACSGSGAHDWICFWSWRF